MTEQRFVASIIFSGELKPDPTDAEAALRMAGFAVTKMPAKFRARLCHPEDDFFTVSKSYSVDSKHTSAVISNAMVATLNEIVERHGAIADDCGPADDDHVPAWWPGDGQ